MHTGGGRPENTAAPGTDTVDVAATGALAENLGKSHKITTTKTIMNGRGTDNAYRIRMEWLERRARKTTPERHEPVAVAVAGHIVDNARLCTS